MNTRILAASTLTVLALGGLAACGSDDTAAPGGTVTHGPSGAPSSTPSSSPSSTPGVPGSTVTPDNPDSPSEPASETPTGPAECTAADVSAAYEADGGAAGTAYGYVVVTNTSDADCVVEGYGGVSYVGGGDGQQVGAAADRDTTDQAPAVEPVTLAPGASARTQVAESEAGNYPAGKCDPTPVDGLRIYLPDDTESLYVEHAATGCSSDAVHLLRNQPYVSA